MRSTIYLHKLKSKEKSLNINECLDKQIILIVEIFIGHNYILVGTMIVNSNLV